MSTSDDNEVAERTKRPVEILEDDVSIISVSNPYGQLKSILLRVLLAVIFLGLGVGAVVYSVANSEENSTTSTENKTVEEYFDIYLNQKCKKGLFTMEHLLFTTKGNNISESQRIRFETDSAWIQDNTNQRLYFRIGLTEENWIFTDYVHSTFTVHSTKKNCTKNYGVPYERYITNLGLTNLRKSDRNERIFMHGIYEAVTLYDGPANEYVTVSGIHPAVIFGYSNPNNGITYGWELYFPHTQNTSLYHMEFSFANMTNGRPADIDIFYDYPPACERNIVNDTNPLLNLYNRFSGI